MTVTKLCKAINNFARRLQPFCLRIASDHQCSHLGQRHAGAAAEALLLDGGLPRPQLPRDVRGQPVLLDLYC